MPETADKPPKAISVKPPPDSKSESSEESKRQTRRPAGRPPSLEKRLEDTFLMIGLVVSPLNQTDGIIIGQNAHSLAVAWNNLAKENSKVKRALERAMEGGAWGQAIFATGAMVVPIAMNHGIIPAIPMFGAPEEPAEEPPPRPAPGPVQGASAPSPRPAVP